MANKWKTYFFVLLAFSFLIIVSMNWSYEFEQSKTKIFTFELEEENTILDGELFLDNISIGFTNKGNITIPFLNKTFDEIKLIGVYQDKYFEVTYKFPKEEYGAYNIFPFAVSREYIEKYDYVYKLRKNDSFSNHKELHWSHMPLSYIILKPEKCRQFELKRIDLGLRMLESFTDKAVSFIKIDRPAADIIFNCNFFQDVVCKEENFNYNKTLFYEYSNLVNQTLISSTNESSTWLLCYYLGEVLGEARPLFIENIILNATINVYYDNTTSDCLDFPLIILHELLHGFGFGHNVNEKTAEAVLERLYYNIHSSSDKSQVQDIMFPKRICLHQKEINKIYISCLKKIYKNDKSQNCDYVSFI